MLIHHEDFLPDGIEYVNAEFSPRIIDDDGSATAFIEALARTEGADTEGGDFICSSRIGLAMSGEALGRMDEDRDDDFDKDF